MAAPLLITCLLWPTGSDPKDTHILDSGAREIVHVVEACADMTL